MVMNHHVGAGTQTQVSSYTAASALNSEPPLPVYLFIYLGISHDVALTGLELTK